MSKPAPPPIDMEALVRRRTKTAETGQTHPVNLEALVRRPPAPPPPQTDAAKAYDMEALVQRPKTKPTPPPSDWDTMARRPQPEPWSARNAPPVPDMEALVRRAHDAPTPAAPSSTRRREDALVARAREIEPSVVDGMRFNTRLHRFLDLKPTAWTTWGEDEARVIVQAASTQAEASRQLSLANAVKWAAECEQAYSRPPGFFDRFAQNAKPEFYRVRLEQARDAIIKVQATLMQLQLDLKNNLERIRIDALVLQVATEHEQDPSLQITATRRLQTLVQVQTTGAMILQGADTLAHTCATQAGTVSNLLAVTIPNWIMAQQNR